MAKAVPSGSDTSQQYAGVSPSKVGALGEKQQAEYLWELPWSHPRAALEEPCVLHGSWLCNKKAKQGVWFHRVFLNLGAFSCLSACILQHSSSLSFDIF